MNVLFVVLGLAIAGMILQGAFIAVEHKGEMVLAVVMKGTAALFFVIIGFIGYIQFLGSAGAANTDPTQGLTKSICLMICLGLLFGMLGDILLGLRFVFESILQKLFLAGILIFFIGHIMYMVALIPMSVNLGVCILCGAIIAVILIIIIFKTMEVKPAFQIFGFFYIEAVVIMTAIAIGNRIAVDSAFRTWFAVGAVLFTISDIIMIFNTFGKEQKFFLRILNLSLYYVGQLLIAVSLFFV